MAKSYLLKARTKMEVDLETVRLYYVEYAKGTLVADMVDPTKDDLYGDILFADLAPNADGDFIIDLLALGVFIDTQSSYKIGLSYLDDLGNESNIVSLVDPVRFDNQPPSDPEYVSLIINIT